MDQEFMESVLVPQVMLYGFLGCSARADGLQLDFAGSRGEAICKLGIAAPAAVRINGRKPSEFAELYGFTRAVTKPEGKWLVKWPVIAPLGSEKTLLIEDWMLDARKDPENDQLFKFTISGSKTGA